MILRNLNYSTWLKNHHEQHHASWFRQYYPFLVLSKIKINQSLITKVQEIQLGRIRYRAKIRSITPQENNRTKIIVHLSDSFSSKTQKWQNRSWSTDFVIIASKDGEFITVFTKKKDPTKQLIIDFNQGRFEKLADIKSIPLSNILIQSSILGLAEKIFPGGKQDQNFEWLPQGVTKSIEHNGLKRKKSNFFNPLYSLDRVAWVCYSFNEEKAHRIGIYNGDQCERLYVIYINPTFTKHHRCKYEHVQIISLTEFSALTEKSEIIGRQIKFLQNHMNPFSERLSKKGLLEEISNPKKTNYEILKSDLMEAMAMMKLVPSNQNEMFYYLSAMNLINAFINKERKGKTSKSKMFKEMYFFKSYLTKVLDIQVSNNSILGELFIGKGVVYVKVLDFQFSFHSIKMTEVLKHYANSNNNVKMEWSGIRLQPIAPLVLKLARYGCPKGITTKT